MPVPDTTPLVIAVLTFRRPDDLAAILPALVTQARSSTIPASVVVVDNDPAASARAFVTAQDPTMVRYVHEPEPGIAAARSRAMTEAGASRLLVFIDDDERPTEGWLNHLLATQRRTGAAAVVGPVISEYAHPPDPWISAGNFFTRRRMPTGTAVTVAATNNLLLDLEQVRHFGLAFDRRYGLLGGEDTLFTRRLSQQGGKIVWCNEAVVVDRVPANRLTRSWVLHRAFSSGNSWSRVSLELASTTVTRVLGRIRLVLAGLMRIAGGSARVVPGVVGRSLTWQARGARTVARGAGMVSGAIGYVYREYRRT
ncbi:glycosyltransferase family 2 protein [Arthrobacter echini]|uniref:Glycosyltransferase family 2 protein n=1 Tax=Arthrobacter echini TaxID=1529066 RepID=A0A4V3Z5U6_9MICC|nr:glycosyltransferase [Arthrobacter echini]THJ67839.1 glycosyltransferase family 2 protein [Arthrobacter echini]